MGFTVADIKDDCGVVADLCNGHHCGEQRGSNAAQLGETAQSRGPVVAHKALREVTCHDARDTYLVAAEEMENDGFALC